MIKMSGNFECCELALYKYTLIENGHRNINFSFSGLLTHGVDGY